MFSAALLILNFLGTRNQFRRIRETTEHGQKALSPEERTKQIEVARRSQQWCHRRETTIHYNLGVHGVLILILVYFKS